MVEYAELDYQLHLNTIPNDPYFTELWALQNTGQNGGLPEADIHAPEAWHMTTGVPDIVIGLIDTGVDYTHEDLSTNMWVNPGEVPANGIDDDQNGYVDDVYGIDTANDDSDPFDDNGHGTHVAGIIGAVGNNRIGVTGVNWEVSIMALKFLNSDGTGWISDAIECLEYAIRMKRDYGVNIQLTNNSWGGSGFSHALAEAITAAGEAGVLFVAAAGNDSSSIDARGHYPAAYDLDNIIAVAATNRYDELAWFSNWGSQKVHLGAPGHDILSTTPGDTYTVLSGTSMAAPHVSGTAAALWAELPSSDLYDIKEILLATVDKVAALDGKVLSNGRLNFFNAMVCDASSAELMVSLQDGVTVHRGVPVTLTAKLRACGRRRGATVTVELSNTDTGLILRDDGVTPDRTGNDGLYTAIWVPNRLGAVTLRFQAVSDGHGHAAMVTAEVIEFSGYFTDDKAAFHWIDIRQSGTGLNLHDDDYAFFEIPFPVRFYNQIYRHMAVGSNGLIYFQDDDLGGAFENTSIPSDTGHTNAFIAAFWDDLNPFSGGNVYWDVRGVAPDRTLIIQFDQVPHYVQTGDSSFQIILYEGLSDVLMQYLDVEFGNTAYDRGASATVGLQRDSAFGQQYAFNQPVLRDGMSIRWKPATTFSPVMASSYQTPNAPENTLDGSQRTRWSAHGHGEWIQYDLGTITPLQQVAIAWYRGDRRRATFDIAVSTDATDWTAVVSRGTSNSTTQDLETYTFEPVLARYVRIIGFGNTENRWNSITEVNIQAVIASSYQAPNVPAHTLDGSRGTRWSAEGLGEWIQYDLLDMKTLQQVAIAWYRGNHRRASFDIAVSPDAENWTQVFRGRSSGRTRRLESYTFDPIQVRYVRIIGYGNTENRWNSLTEVRFQTGDDERQH